jgi:hypothetical protein
MPALTPATGCFDGAVHLYPVCVHFEDTDVPAVWHPAIWTLAKTLPHNRNTLAQ